MNGDLVFSQYTTDIHESKILKDTNAGKITFVKMGRYVLSVGNINVPTTLRSLRRIEYIDGSYAKAEHPLGLGVYGLIELTPNTATSGTLET